MNLANEVSSMETQLASLLAENEILKKNRAVMEFENEQLRRALDKCQADRDRFLRRSEAIKTLLDQTGASLVSGIRQYHDNEREIQEQALQVGNEADMPNFLSAAQKRLTETLGA